MKSRVVSQVFGEAESQNYTSLQKKFFKHLFIFERETERDRERNRTQAREGQRERETQNRKQAPGSQLSAQSPRGARTHKRKSRSPTLNWWSHPGAPQNVHFSIFVNKYYLEFPVKTSGQGLGGPGTPGTPHSPHRPPWQSQQAHNPTLSVNTPGSVTNLRCDFGPLASASQASVSLFRKGEGLGFS